MANFLVTGGTGFIGTRLVRDMAAAGHRAVVLTRNPDKHQGRYGDSVRYLSRFEEIDSSTLFTAVINLGGEGIGDKRWSEKRKTETNAEFTRGIGLAISRPTIFPLPAFMVKLLFGEMGDRLLLQGQHVVPARLLQAGFEFDYPALKDALTESLVR